MTRANSRSDWYDGAFALLAEQGYAGLKLEPLCRSLGLTTGAFYHSFKNWRDFTERLLQSWKQERTTRLVELARSQPEPLQQLEVLVAVTVALPHRAEAAIRVWSTLDPTVAAVQEAVDQERLSVVRAAFREMLDDDDAAQRYAEFGMFLLIGFEQSGALRDPASLEWSLRRLLHAAVGDPNEVGPDRRHAGRD